MGNLFYRGVSPGEIEAMTYRRMKYWNGWHEVFIEATTPKPTKQKGK